MSAEIRMPPNDQQAERGILGGCLRDNDAIDDVADLLTAEDFYANAHRILWRCFTALRAAGQAVDLVTVAQWINAEGKRSECGYDLVSDLEVNAPIVFNLATAAGIVRDFALKRAVIHAAGKMATGAHDIGANGQDVLQDAEKAILELGERGRPKAAVHISVAVEETLTVLDQRQKPDGVKLLRTGFANLDRVIVGLEPGALVIVAARPSVGKTAFALNLANNFAKAGEPVHFASLEQSRAELTERLLAHVANVDGYRMKRGTLCSDEGESIGIAAKAICNMPWHIDDTASQTVFHLASATRRARSRFGVAAVLVDYLQLITPEDRRQPRHEQVQDMTRRLKFVARENKIPVIVLAQLNRELEKRADGKPKLSDLRESGAIEQDADTVLLLHSEQQQATAFSAPGDVVNLEVIVAKHRNGMTGSVPLCFHRPTMRIYDRGAM